MRKQNVSLPKVISVLIQNGHSQTAIESFLNYHKGNKQTWVMFEDVALDLCLQGKNRLNSKAIFEELRKSPIVQSLYKDWKVNNTYSSFYPRIFEIYYPIFAGRFEMRTVQLELVKEA